MVLYWFFLGKGGGGEGLLRKRYLFEAGGILKG